MPSRSKDGLPSEIIRSLYPGPVGTLWIGTDSGGLVRSATGSSRRPRPATACRRRPSSRSCRTATAISGSAPRAAASYRFSHGTFTAFRKKDGLSDDTVLALYEDADGCLWIGTDGGGLNRFRDGKFTRFTRQQGLFDDVQYAILEDGRGNLWMSCSRGIFRVHRADLEDLAEGRRDSVVSQSYGRADGMRSAECSGFTQPAAWKTRDGKLWFPTIEGAVVIDPDRIRTNTLPPPVVIDRVWWTASDVVAHPDASEVEPGRGDLEFHYAGLSFVDPDRVTFRYMLEGFDREWVDAGARRVAFYTNIPPGPYTFRVRAANNDGVWSERDAVVRFRSGRTSVRRAGFSALCASVWFSRASGPPACGPRGRGRASASSSEP